MYLIACTVVYLKELGGEVAYGSVGERTHPAGGDSLLWELSSGPGNTGRPRALPHISALFCTSALGPFCQCTQMNFYQRSLFHFISGDVLNLFYMNILFLVLSVDGKLKLYFLL